MARRPSDSPTNAPGEFIMTHPLLRFRNALLDPRADSVGLLAALAILVVIFSLTSPFFLATGNFFNIGRAVAINGIVSAVTTIVLISGGLDLSVGAAMAVGGVVTGMGVQAGFPIPMAIGLGLATGAGIGLVNAWLIVGVGVNALIATIGTQFFFRGAGYIWTSGQPPLTFPNEAFSFIGGGNVLDVPVPILLMLGVFIVVAFVMGFTRFGAHVYALGGSEYAARLAGISVGRTRTIVYVASGVSGALAGVLLTSVNGSAYPQAATGAELTIIAAVILGGTALTGGRGSVAGTLIGVALLGVLANGMNLVGIEAFWQTFVQGLVLIIAVTTDEVRRKHRAAA